MRWIEREHFHVGENDPTMTASGNQAAHLPNFLQPLQLHSFVQIPGGLFWDDPYNLRAASECKHVNSSEIANIYE
ncbi:hypothetical protein ANCCAN_12022 [Ancylostoma caninum]|uniref:Uncharacterized protein n=1 Tax=Ancylostoma caninum TaxID=29170 RepID=A0A368GCD7_ANCCA|nr:hypothetical protein ANCCAN_12022 [Ancylostoma caninum]